MSIVSRPPWVRSSEATELTSSPTTTSGTDGSGAMWTGWCD
jgi:hypothetical protein